MAKNNAIIILACSAIFLAIVGLVIYQSGLVSTDILSLKKQSSSTQISDIEADLTATDLENLDAEMEAIQEELGN